MYRLANPGLGQQINSVNKFEDEQYPVCIPFAPDNTDYQTFKTEINDETAQLETVNGVLMTPEEAKAYVATLP